MSFFYQLVEADGRRALTVFKDGDILQATDERPDFQSLVDRVIAGDETVVESFDPAKAITKKFVAITDRVFMRNGQVHFDGAPVSDTAAQAIVRAMEAGEEDWAPLVLFLEKLYQNPNEHSREQLYRWLATHKFTIAADGDILGYKAVNADGYSQSSGYAIVDGKEYNGRIPNKPGSVISMPRTDVTFDPAIGCSQGLHVGTFDYANDFIKSSRILYLVKFNPRDVVSVPTECQDQKVRVCRYEVVEVVDAPLDSAISWDHGDPDNADNLIFHLDDLTE